MDTLTHALCGALAARVVAPRALARDFDAPAPPGLAACTAVGFIAGAFPDSDVLLTLVSPIAYLTGHRGLTHSVLMLPLWAALLAWVFSGFGRRREALRPFFMVCAAAIGVHILGDLVTVFGTMLLAPLSDRRFALSTTFIIDLWFTGIVAGALLASLLLPRWRLTAALGGALLVAYVGLSAIQQDRAREVGLARAQANGWSGAVVTAVPRPVSPFNWMVVVEHEGRYETALVNLRRREPLVVDEHAGFVRRLDAAYLPVALAQWQPATRFGVDADARELAEAVWTHPEFAVLRWFYDLPALYAIRRSDGEQCAWFNDLRFVVPGRAVVPFRYGMCRPGAGSPWQRFEMIGEDGRRPI